MEQYYYGYPLGKAFICYELAELDELKETGRLFRMMTDEEAAEIFMGVRENDA